MDWKRCTEENYPDEDKMENIVIAYSLDDVWIYTIYENCRYGWNVLCKMECYWAMLTPPKKINNMVSTINVVI